VADLNWIPGVVVALIGSSLIWWRSVSIAQAVVDQKLTMLKQENTSVATDLKEASRVLQSVATQVKVSIESQTLVNAATAKAFDSILQKLDTHAREIADHGATLSLMREFMMRVHGDATGGAFRSLQRDSG
jgi:nitrogen fixation/metabolism regulation signal transduction histidine kinase